MDEVDKRLILALAQERTELRDHLAAAQDLLVETAIDAGRLRARIEELHAELIEARGERDEWRARAERRGAGVPARAS